MSLFDTQVENEIRRRRRPETIFENTISMYYNQYCNSLSLTDDDIVMYFRTDIIMNDKKQLETILDGNLEYDEIYVPIGSDWGGLNDQVAIGRGRVMKRYLSVFPNIQKYCLNNGVWFHPESLLKYHVTQERIRLKRFPLSYVLNRNRKNKEYMRQ
jgi:hypothetical protein